MPLAQNPPVGFRDPNPVDAGQSAVRLLLAPSRAALHGRSWLYLCPDLQSTVDGDGTSRHYQDISA